MPLDTDPARRGRYSQGAGIQRILPAAVARPTDLGTLRAVIAEARAKGLPITPRGAGTAMGGGNIGPGVVIDLTAFEPGRCQVDGASRLAVTTPSLTVADLRNAAAPYGLRLPPDPSSASWVTLGGAIATNAAGARSVRFGSVRQWIAGLTLETAEGPLILARGVAPDPVHPAVARFRDAALPQLVRSAGQIRSRFPATRKNSAGYALDAWLASGDLIDLVIGAEGTLGVVTDVRCRLDPVPKARASLRVAMGDRARLDDAIEAIRFFDPSTIEFLDHSFLLVAAGRLAAADASAVLDARHLLLADFEGDDPATVHDTAGRAALAAGAFGTAVIATHAVDIERLWAIRHGASPALAALTDGRRSLQVIEDGCVPVRHLGAYLDGLEALCARERVDAVMFGHAGDGHVHVNLLPDLSQAGWVDRVRTIYHEANGMVIALGGTPSGEHGAGRLRAPLLPRLYGTEVMACMAAVKRAFDPANLFNPGVILGADDPFATLKVGAAAEPIDSDAERWLREVERAARWGDTRW